MITLQVRNVNHALYHGANLLRNLGAQRDSRNGPVLVAPAPVTTVYGNPEERVMLHPGRDANPFFHLVEALWMITGRNDLAPLTKYVKNMSQFSDDGGVTQPGAYGHRWRQHFRHWGSTLDQLAWAVARLKADPNDRRVVIQMYDAEVDQWAADHGGKDVPCNLMALPTVSDKGWLDLTVFNRSNDMVWGAYGANAVHFSVLQELIAALVGVPVGTYYQVSNNFHGYLSTLGKAGTEWPWLEYEGQTPAHFQDPYDADLVVPYTMFGDGLGLDAITDDINMFLADPTRPGLRSGFLRKVACPMVMAHGAYKQGDVDGAHEILDQMPTGNDWQMGARTWLANRAIAQAEKGG